MRKKRKTIFERLRRRKIERQKEKLRAAIREEKKADRYLFFASWLESFVCLGLSTLCVLFFSLLWQEYSFLLLLLSVANFPLYWGLMFAFFRDGGEFLEALRFFFTPDIISAFRGEYWSDLWESFKLLVFFLLCLSLVLGEYHLILSLFYKG